MSATRCGPFLPPSGRRPRRDGRPLYPLAKRIFDCTVAAGLLSVLSPLLAYVAWRVRREDGGPALYRGDRIGRHGARFRMFKFRTMVVNAANLGGPSTAEDDPRLTEWGRTLRRWKLDELPQLGNVLLGDMSLVGPRPQVEPEVLGYTDNERRLLDVRPGITDWASIRFRDEGAILAGHGDPDEAYNRLIRPKKIELGLRYVDEAGFSTDLGILGRTLSCLIHDALTSRAAITNPGEAVGP